MRIALSRAWQPQMAGVSMCVTAQGMGLSGSGFGLLLLLTHPGRLRPYQAASVAGSISQSSSLSGPPNSSSTERISGDVALVVLRQARVRIGTVPRRYQLIALKCAWRIFYLKGRPRRA